MKNNAAPPAAAAPAAAKAAHGGLRDISASRIDMHMVDEKDCVLDPGFNVREDFSHVPAMADAFEATHGETIPPLLGRYSKLDGKMHVTAGESRLRAVRLIKERGGPNILLPFRMEPREDYAVNGLPGDKRTLEILTGNSGRPLNIMEQGVAMRRLVAEHGYDQSRIARALGVSLTHVGNCLRLVNEAHPSLREAVRNGRLSPTLALDLMAAEPDANRQEALLAAAKANAGEGNRITARHIPVHVGKERQQQQREQPAAIPIATEAFDRKVEAGENIDAHLEWDRAARLAPEDVPRGPATAEPPPPPAPPASVPEVPAPAVEAPLPQTPPAAAAPAERKGFDGAPAVVHLDLPRNAKVAAILSVAMKDGRYFCGFEIQGDLQGTRRPLTPDLESFPSYDEARLAAIQAMLGFALKQKTARGGANWELVAGELKALIKKYEDKARAAQPAKPAAAAASTRGASAVAVAKGAHGAKRSVEEFRDLLADIDAKDAHPARYLTARACLKYLEGGCTHSDIARYLLDVDGELGGGSKPSRR